MMRTSVKLGFLDRVPVKAPEQQGVLTLHMGKEAPARRAACGRPTTARRMERGAEARQFCDISAATARRDPHQVPGAVAWMRTVPTTS